LKAALESDIYKQVKNYKTKTLLKNHQRQLKGLSCLHSQRWQRNPEEIEKTCAEHSARLAREKLPTGVQFTKSNGSYGVCIATRFGTMKKRTTSWDFAVELLQKFRRPPEEMRMFFGYRTQEEIKASVAKNAEMVAAGEALPEGVSWIEDLTSNGAKKMWRATRHVLGFGLCSQNLALWEWVKHYTKLVDEHNAAYRLEHANDTEDESDDEANAPVRCSAVSDDDESDESDDDDPPPESPALMVNNRPKRSSTLVRRVYVEPGDDPIEEAIAEAAAAEAAKKGSSSSSNGVIVIDDEKDIETISIAAEVVEATESSSSESSSDDVPFVDATVVSAAKTSGKRPRIAAPPPPPAPAPVVAPPPSPPPEKNDLQTKLEALAKLKSFLSPAIYERRQTSLLVQAGL